MLTNYHTHCTFCDGKSTAEEVVLSALNKGFAALGFSSHGGFVNAKQVYASIDIEGYIKEIDRLKEKYKKDIQIYRGIEEDQCGWIQRDRYQYMLGSVHYLLKGGKYLSIDGGVSYFQECVDAFGGDAMAFAEAYYQLFCDYIAIRKPDIIGHFDLITKFEEVAPANYFGNRAYHDMAKKYIREAAKSGCIFEVNTGAISRGYRTLPYPHEELLYELKKLDAPIMVNADSHHADTLDCYFAETKAMLREIGFRKSVALYNNEFQSVEL